MTGFSRWNRVAAGAVLATALSAAASAWAQSQAPMPPAGVAIAMVPAAKTFTVRGTFVVKVALQVSPDLPDGTSVTLSTEIGTLDASYNNLIFTPTQAIVSGGGVAATVTLPFAWLVASQADQVTVNLLASGSANGEFLNNSQTSTTIDLPKDGAKTVVNLQGTL